MMEEMLNELLKKVSEKTGVSVWDIKSQKKSKYICTARLVFMHLAKKNLGCGCLEIGCFLNRTPQTISCQLLNFEQSLKVYRALYKKVKRIENEII